MAGSVPAGAVVRVNEALIFSAFPGEVSNAYARWTMGRAGVTGGGLTEYAEVACFDVAHARDVVAMLVEWGVPQRALKVRKAVGVC